MATRYFHWDTVNDCVMSETDESGNTIVTYTREPGPDGRLISEERNGTTYTHHDDGLGNTQFLTDDSGNITDTFTYDAWGNEIARTGTTPTPYRWGSRWGYQYDTLHRRILRSRTQLPTNCCTLDEHRPKGTAGVLPVHPLLACPIDSGICTN